MRPRYCSSFISPTRTSTPGIGLPPVPSYASRHGFTLTFQQWSTYELLAKGAQPSLWPSRSLIWMSNDAKNFSVSTLTGAADER